MSARFEKQILTDVWRRRRKNIVHVQNELQRNFKQGVAGKVLLTDITYLTYKNGKRAYLSTIKDAETNEILAYEISDSLSMDIALNTLRKLKRNHYHLTEDAFIHSDQGFHYTNPQFQGLVKEMGLGQSMSRRGNCWDNSPQESFFGHFKDETNIKECETLEEVKREVKSYMTYYNYYRGQWNLKKLPPVKYRQQLLTSCLAFFKMSFTKGTLYLYLVLFLVSEFHKLIGFC